MIKSRKPEAQEALATLAARQRPEKTTLEERAPSPESVTSVGNENRTPAPSRITPNQCLIVTSTT